MNEKKRSELSKISHLLGFFDLQVLAAYQNEPDKYYITTDNFDGHITLTKDYYQQMEASGKIENYIDVKFGYRTLIDGGLALVAWLPDLFEKSKNHLNRWKGFYLEKPIWCQGEDTRFTQWFKRYVNGSWEVDNGPLYYIQDNIRKINGITSEIVSSSLFKYDDTRVIQYPAAQNTHMYQDAHIRLYGILIDGLNKECLLRIASIKNITVEQNKKTIKLLCHLFPILKGSSFIKACELMSAARGEASHGIRESAQYYSAFEQFSKDLSLCIEGLKEVLCVFEEAFGLEGEYAMERTKAKDQLPKIVMGAEPHYSIGQSDKMIGKTIKKVEYGFREDIEGVHGSEVLIIHFTDDSILSIDTGSNVGNIVDNYEDLDAQEFKIDFILRWVPGREKQI